MMPLGSHNGGGRYSSSSNLSPLAPPFTLDKPYQNQPNFTEPPYGSLFDSPCPVWTPSNYIENGSRKGNFSSEVHGFPPGSQPNNSLTASLGSLNSVVSDGYDGFPYGRYSNSVPTSLVDAKPYYLPYVAVDDRDLVAPTEPRYDLLSNFAASKLSGSSQVGDTRLTSSVEYSPEWSGLWNGLSVVEQGNWLDLGGSFGPKDYKPSDSSAAQKCMKKGFDSGVDHYDSRVGTLPVGSLEPYVETSIQLKNYFGGFGGEISFGSTSIEDHKSVKEPNPGATTVSCIGAPAMGSTPACYETRHLQDPFPQSPLPKYFGLYESPFDSQDKHANYADSYFLDSASTMRSSPANTTKKTFGGFPSPQDALPSITMNSMNNEGIEESSDFLPYHPFGRNCQVRNYAGQADSIFTRLSSTKMDDNLSMKQGNDEGFELKTKFVFPSPHLSKIKSDTAETFYSKEISSDGPEIQNPAVDSPCWKGALETRVSSVEDSKLAGPDFILGKLESCFKLYSGEHKKSSTGLDKTDTIHVSEEVKEKTFSNKSLDANYVSKECDDSCSMKQSLHGLELRGGDGFRPLDKKNQLDLGIGNELNFLNCSGIASSFKSPWSLQINSEDREVVPEEKLALKVVASVAPTNVGNDLHSPSENVAASKVGYLSGKDSKVDASVLINAMKTLSEGLMNHCLNNNTTSTELDHVALKHIIGNLNSCMVKEADQVTKMEKAEDSQRQQGTPCLEDALQSQMVRKVTTAHMNPHVLDYGDIFCRRNEGLLDTTFLKDNAETARDADTIKDIKMALDKKFPSEELQPETVLYKNLWLEAEASLCAMSVRSRFNHMKIEMEKKECHGTNDEENVPIPKAASDVNEVAELPNEAKDSLNSSKHSYPTDMESSVIGRFRTLRSVVEDLKSLNTEAHHEPTLAFPSVSPQSNANDIEASIMARLQILKSRVDNLESMNAEDGKSPIKNAEAPSSNHSFQDSFFSSVASHKDDPGASVMSRFNILKSRTEHSDLLHMDTQQIPRQVDGSTWTSFITTESGSEDSLGVFASSNPGNNSCKMNGHGEELLEEWEHVIEEVFPKQK